LCVPKRLDPDKTNEYSFFMPKISDARKDARRSQILAAAVRCFARDGFQGATIPDICAEAGVSVGAIYGYFDSKDAIVAALANHGRQATSALIGDPAGGSPEARLRAVLGALARPGAAETFQLDVRAWGEAIGNQTLRETVIASQTETTGALAALLRPLAVARGIAPEALGALVAAVIAGCEVRRAVSQDADLAPQIEALLALLRQS
jgi:AcrR family transcriptional regulator